MSFKSTVKVMPGIPFLRLKDKYAAYLGSAIGHIKAQECPVKVMDPYVTTNYSGRWQEGDKSKLRAITDRLNNIVDHFRTTDASHLWIVDADVEVPKHGLCELLKLDVDIASGIYTFHSNRNMASFGRIPNTEKYNFVPRSIGFLRGRILGEDFMVGGGNGCMLIKRRVFKKYHPSFSPLSFITPDGAGSDLYFWYSAQKAGFTARLHGGVICGHLPNFPLSQVGDYQFHDDA